MNAQAAVFCSVVTESEFVSGIGLDTNLQDFSFLSDIEFFEVTSEIARLAGRIRRKQKELVGRRLKTPDALILATAIVHDCALVTADSDLSFGKEYGIDVINFRKLEEMDLF
jgi:predicted nucleic acid-binding protein